MLRKDLTLQKFNKLHVIEFSHKDHANKSYWTCLCNCGKETCVQGSNLTSGSVKSCGCLTRESVIKRSTTHGLSKRNGWHPLYTKYAGILRRCNNTKEVKYRLYGGRGIKCTWSSFEEFYNDMVDGFNKHVEQFGLKNTTIERVDVNGNYCKSNCTWATWKEQRNNQRKFT